MDNFSVGSVSRDPYHNQGLTDSGNRKKGKRQNSPGSTDSDVVILSEQFDATERIEDGYAPSGLTEQPK